MLLFNGSEARVAVTPDKTVYDTLIHNGVEYSNVVTLDCYTYGGNNYRWLFNGVNNVYFMGDSWTGDNYADVNVGTEYNSKLNKGLSYTKTSDAVYLGMNVERFFVMSAVYAFSNCSNLKTFYNSATPVATNVILNYVTLGKKNCQNLFNNCANITGSPVCSDNVVRAEYMYFLCSNLTGSPVCGINVRNANGMYTGCSNLTGSPVCGDNVVDAAGMYSSCRNLTGSPVCGDNVWYAGSMYRNCVNLTGSPVCGANVTNASYMFYDCSNLTGDVYINSTKKLDASRMFYNCGNLTGNVYVSVNDASYMFYNCVNLTGDVHISANYAIYMFNNCVNLAGNVYIYSTKLSGMSRMFGRCVNLSKKVHINHLVPMETSNYIYNCLVNNFTGVPFAPENIYNDL